ncbi:hypothetical protein PUN28_004077 [Cardiocondyla obscurior]|uniref:Uncharacterized protein n=1 Tax=Cardiocondyla obscurior TaxID=286306 RepID=A0AAW2GP83_9HYME
MHSLGCFDTAVLSPDSEFITKKKTTNLTFALLRELLELFISFIMHIFIICLLIFD